jgi:hypothetical protein
MHNRSNHRPRKEGHHPTVGKPKTTHKRGGPSGTSQGTNPVIATTHDRVPQHTAPAINERIQRQIDANVAHFASAGRTAISRRLAELDREWDIERYVETMAPTFTLIGLVLGAAGSKKWLLLPAMIQSFFLQHALQGWCPPIPLLRRLGVRTADEINQERYALKMLRGDFQRAAEVSDDGNGRVSQVMKAVRR